MKLLKRKFNLVILSALFVLAGSGCDSLLDVENPNSLTEDDIYNPSSATGLKNGLLHQLMVGMSWTYAATSTTSDELYWTGSYESYSDFDSGNLDVNTNEIVVAGFPEISQARYMGDLAVETLTEIDGAGNLSDPTDLTRSLIYSALVKIIIAENYDNFVISNRQETSPPVGAENMDSFLTDAISLLDRAASRAENTTLEAQAIGLRARAKHSLAMWAKLNPAGTIPANPLVSGSGASSDAEAALALMDADYKATFNYQSALFTNYMAGQVNSRGEITPVEPIFMDLKTGETDPRAAAIITDFMDIATYTENYPPYTWLSAREMHLIIAEEAIGTSDPTAIDHMNAVRSLDNLPEIIPGDDLVAFIEHERRANLFFQGRRLLDMYRFNTSAPQWDASQDPVGTLLPIPQNEIEANPNI